MDYSIAIILPSTLTYDTTKKVLNELKLEYPLYKASENEAVNIANELIKKGTRIIISTGLAYMYLQREISIPLLGMPFSGIDAAIAVKKALSCSKKIVHIGTQNLFHYLQKSLVFFGIDTDCIHFCEVNTKKTLEEQTLKMISEGYEVFIGGYLIVEQAQKHNKHGIEVNVDELVIRSTIENAQSILKETLEKEKQNELDNAILNATSEGIIAIDENNIIVMANPAAERIMQGPLHGLNYEVAMKKNNIADIDTFAPYQSEDVSPYTLITANKLPIIVHGETKGMVISIKKISDIQELQYKTKKDLYLRGFNADHHFDEIKGNSKAITQAVEKAKVYSKYDSTILISGETGTGKELFAQSIHNTSRRKLQPFVSVNCAALPENLIESELFGYVKGAFTGANKEGKMGLFELADGGTIFLDEISEIPISTQSKLLRVIEEGDVIRLGSDRIRVVDTRIICSSNKDLLQLINEKKFKEDLYYRICVLEINLPPLRQRKEDIKELANAIILRFSQIHNKNIVGIEPEALKAIETLPLFGNVRELSNIIERMIILSDKPILDRILLMETINISDLQTDIQEVQTLESALIPNLSTGNLKDIQKEMILSALEQHNGNKAATARALGIDPSTLWRRLKKYGLS